MARIPPLKRLQVEEFPEQKKWIDKLFSPLNQFMENVVRAMDKGMTIRENMAADVRTVVADGTYPIKIRWDLSRAPVGAIVVACREANSATHTTITTAVYADCTFTTSEVTIHNITGISPTPSNKFNVSLLIITG